MVRNHFIVSIRKLIANRVNTIINVLGLVIGIASALILVWIIRFELSFDRFHSNADAICPLAGGHSEDGEGYGTGITYPLAPAIASEIPAIKDITLLMYWSWGKVQVDVTDEKGGSSRKFQESRGLVFADPSFFQMFDFNNTNFRWISGNPKTALVEPNAVVLTRSIAKKYFGEMNALGMMLRIAKDWNCRVTGVVEDLPQNTDFPFTLFLSFATLTNNWGDHLNDWSASDQNECYVRLPDSMGREEAENLIQKIYAAHGPKEFSNVCFFKLQPMSEVHKDSRFGNLNQRTVSMERIGMLSAVGLFLLFTACFNYVNINTAQSSIRSKEIGLRKILGSTRRQLILQLIFEAFLIALISGVIGLLLAEMMIEPLQTMMSVKTTGYLFLDPFILKCLVAMIIFVTILSGLYPAFLVSNLNPLAAIQNRLHSLNTGIPLRSLLVVIQFSITQMFMIGTFVLLNQMRFFQNINLGFEREATINIELQNNDQRKINLFKDLLQSDPAISSVSLSSTFPSGNKRTIQASSISRKETGLKENEIIYEYQAIDEAYINLYKIKLLAGRNFNASDSLNYVIINHNLAMKLGFASDEAAIGRELFVYGRLKTVVGVIADFHSESLKEKMGNIAMVLNPREYQALSIKLNGPSAGALTRIEKAWSSTFPETVISYQFFDENIAAYYETEKKFSSLLQVFSTTLLFIACLGLYGLITFVVNSKLKEVAVRKVLGAGISNILVLVSRDHFKLIVVAFFIAAPIAYYFADQWLSNFAYRIQIEWMTLVIPGVIVFIVAMLAVSSQMVKASRSNPAEILKYE